MTAPEGLNWQHFEEFRYHDGVLEFTVPREHDGFTSLVYGTCCGYDDFQSDQARTYDCWELPPSSADPDFRLTEIEIRDGRAAANGADRTCYFPACDCPKCGGTS